MRRRLNSKSFTSPCSIIFMNATMSFSVSFCPRSRMSCAFNFSKSASRTSHSCIRFSIRCFSRGLFASIKAFAAASASSCISAILLRMDLSSLSSVRESKYFKTSWTMIARLASSDRNAMTFCTTYFSSLSLCSIRLVQSFFFFFLHS